MFPNDKNSSSLTIRLIKNASGLTIEWSNKSLKSFLLLSQTAVSLGLKYLKK